MSRVIHNGLSTGAPGYRVDDPSVSPVPLHGGRLNAAAARYGIPREQWLDLSTGINPNGWPLSSARRCLPIWKPAGPR